MPFVVRTADAEFVHSRRHLSATNQTMKGSNISAVWNNVLQETLVNGVVQGRKQTDPLGASALSRARMFQMAADVREQFKDIPSRLGLSRIGDRRQSLADRETVKEEVRSKALKGWVRNEKPI